MLQGYVDKARKGDRNAFEELVKWHTNYVYNLAYHLTGGNRSDSDDLAQMTFIRAFQAMKRFEGRSEFKTWLHRITVNLWKNLVRSQKRRKYFQHRSINEDPTDESRSRPLELEETRQGPLENVENLEISQIVREMINQLPADEKEVIILRDIEGYAYDEIAEMVSIPLGTVKSRLARARRLLRNALDPILSIIPERNSEARTFKVVGSTKRLDKLFANTLQKVAEILELTVTPADQKVFDIVPGTHLLSAFHSYTNAIVLLKKPAIKNNTRIKAVLYFTEALKSDAGYLSARVGRAACRINLAKTARGKSAKRYITLAKNDVDKAVRINPVDPLLLNAQAGYLMLFKKYADAKKIAEKNLALYPANHENYLLLGKIYRALKMTAEAEKILLQGLDQQGTALQKKAFHRELGLLLLKKKDKHEEVYLKEVLKLEPNNYRLYYLRATALFRLKRYLDVMTEIQKAEVLKKWRDLNLLKAETVLALGNVFYEEGDYDRAFSYASIAINIRDRHFETLLLMAKVLRKKGFRLEAKRQLEAARKLARKKHPKDHLWLGTECVSQTNNADHVF